MSNGLYIRPSLYTADSQDVAKILSLYHGCEYGRIVQRIDDAILNIQNLTSSDRRELLKMKAECLCQLEQYDEAQGVLREHCRPGGLMYGDVFSILLRAWILLLTGDVAAAVDHARRLIKDFPSCRNDAASMGAILHLRGRAYYHMGRTKASARDLRDSIALYRIAGDMLGVAVSQAALAALERSTKSLEAAVECCAESISAFEQVGNTHRARLQRIDLAVCYLKIGEYERCNSLLDDLGVDEKVSFSLGASLGVSVVKMRSAMQSGRGCDLYRDLMQGLDRVAKSGLARVEAIVLETLSDWSFDSSEEEKGKRFLDRAIQVVEGHGLWGEMYAGLKRRDVFYHFRYGNPVVAIEKGKEALKTCRSAGEKYEEGLVLRYLSRAYLSFRQFRTAWKFALDSVDLFVRTGARYELARSRETAALVQWEWHQSLVETSSEDYRAASVLMDEDSRQCEPDDLEHVELTWSFLTAALHYYAAHGYDSAAAECKSWMADVQRIVTPIWARRGSESCGLASEVSTEIFIANAPSMHQLSVLVEVASCTTEPTLVTGETGTGKELIARMIHEKGERSNRPFVPVNCAAIPETLFEREFFGHAKGAYTGAEEGKPGLCEEADGGTLFLDEIGDMPSFLQVKLLRLLQEGTYRRLGDPEERTVDLRIIAATNAPLPDLIAAGRFRQDLYYRLQTLEMPVPPLRERPEDLEDLMDLFIFKALGEEVPASQLFNRGVLGTFRRYPWPGNVRELEAMTRRMALLARHAGQASVEDLPEQMASWRERRGKERGSLSLSAYLETAERGRIDQALILKGGNRSEAARALGISRNQLYRKMEKLGIRAPR